MAANRQAPSHSIAISMTYSRTSSCLCFSTRNLSMMNAKSTRSFLATLMLLAALSPSSLAFSTLHDRPKSFVQRDSLIFVSHGPAALRMSSEPEAKKETTWDRITGPKLFKTVTNWNGIHSVPLAPLRIMTGLLMIHHGSEGKLVALSELERHLKQKSHLLSSAIHRWPRTSKLWNTRISRLRGLRCKALFLLSSWFTRYLVGYS